MNTSLADISLTEASLDGTMQENIATIFTALPAGERIILHVSADGNLANTCPESRGTFDMFNIDDTLGVLSFTERVTGKYYTASYTSIKWSGWMRALTETEEDADDSIIEDKVEVLENAVGDINLLDHYGSNIVSILNKYTRQVLNDSSTTANQIILEDYFGNIQDITYNTPLKVQVANDSTTGGATIKFIKAVEGQANIEKTYPLMIVDLSGTTYDDYRAITSNDLTKYVFYDLVKREYETTPGDPSTLTDIFVVTASSGSSEINSLVLRIENIEELFDAGLDTLGLASLVCSAQVSAATVVTTGNATIGGNLDVTGTARFRNSTKTEFDYGINSGGTSTFTDITLSGILNLAAASVTLKSSPGGSDLVNKTYVDGKATAATAAALENFSVGTAVAPATGTPGTFYFQLES